jgi:uncharacterized protein
MTSASLIMALQGCRAALEAQGATSLFLYGSRSRGDHRSDSDIDLLVGYDPGKKFSLFDLAGVKLVIERELGLEAHVTTRDALYPELRSQIEQKAIRVF